MPQRFLKDPDAVLDYKWDWTDWLATSPTDTISSYTITADTGLTVDSDSNTTTAVTVWLSGGDNTKGKIYKVLCRVVTTLGRTADRTIYIVMSPK